MGKCNYKHEGIVYDGEDCPVCALQNEVIRLKRDVGEKMYARVAMDFDRETWERIIHLSNLYGPAEGVTVPLSKATKLGVEMMITQIEEKNK